MSSFANYIDKNKDFICPSGKIKNIIFTQDETDTASKKYVNDTVNAFGGVDNPMIVDLNANNYEITNVKKVTANQDGFFCQGGGYITADGNIYSATGTITADSGDITSNSGRFICGNGDYKALNGDFVATTGNFTTDSGDITTDSGNITTDSGNISSTSGNISTIGGNITANQVLISGVNNTVSAAGGFSTNSGNMITNSGNITTTTGDLVTNSGNITCNSGGNISTLTGDIFSTSGNISCENGQLSCDNMSIANDIVPLFDFTTDIGSSTKRIREAHMEKSYFYDSGLTTSSTIRHNNISGTDRMLFNTGGQIFGFSANPVDALGSSVVSDGFEYVISSNTDKGFRPVRDNTSNLGRSNRRWKAVYAVNGVIQTSNLESKKNITPCKMGLGFLNKLKPRMYHYKEESDSDPKRCGLIWEDLNEVSPNFRGLHKSEGINEETGETEEHYGIAYDQLIIPLVAGVQELYAENVSLKSQLASQRKMIDDLQLQINQIKLKI